MKNWNSSNLQKQSPAKKLIFVNSQNEKPAKPFFPWVTKYLN